MVNVKYHSCSGSMGIFKKMNIFLSPCGIYDRHGSKLVSLNLQVQTLCASIQGRRIIIIFYIFRKFIISWDSDIINLFEMRNK